MEKGIQNMKRNVISKRLFNLQFSFKKYWVST